MASVFGEARVSDFALFVPDLDRSVAFYTDVFGLEVHRRDIGFVELSAGGMTLALWETADAEASLGLERIPQSGYHVMIALHVETVAEVDGISATLKARGVRFLDGPKTYAWNAHAAYFQDPDANMWEVYTWVAPPRTIEDGS